jgi:hypothetical protein
MNLNVHDLSIARARIADYVKRFEADGTRITENLDFGDRMR